MSTPGDDSCDDVGELIRAIARTPEVTPFSGTERYRVHRALGEGGFGVVYEVEDRELGRRLALKMLKPERGGYAANIHRLKNEFRTVADLVHPNLVGLHELATDGARWFFTMDLVRGCDVLEFVYGESPEHPRGDRSGVLSEVRLRACLSQLVAGVSKLHDAGIVHRDLKPSNVLVERDGRVVILDFGLAASEVPDDHGHSTRGAGTPMYMAPEQMAGAPGTAAADWYAVGVMLYQALTGELPFGEASPAELATAKLTRDPVPPSQRTPVPADLERLCLALLRAEPAARPDAEAIVAMLGEAAPPSTNPPRERRVFVGRAPELAVLRAAYADVRRRRAQLVRMAGQPGVGKSSLLARFLDELGDAAVLAGRCHERESVPYKAFDGIADALVRYLRTLPRSEAAALMPRDIHLVAQLFPVLESVAAVRDVPRRPATTGDPREMRSRAFAALKELLGRIADKQPLVIAIDDIQWGDRDSATLLAQLVAMPDPPALLLVLCHRAEASTTVQETLRTLAAAAPHAIELVLDPLPPSDAEQLAARLLGEDVASDAARTIARRGEGHPLFMAELARAQRAPDGAAGPPPTLLDILWERVVTLSAASRQLLETVAVAGQPLPAALCFEAAGLDAGGVDVLRALRAEQLVRTGDAGAINVFHDRIRDTILAHVDARTTKMRHLALAHTLERRTDPDPEVLAHHFDAAEEHAKAGRYALSAGDAAMRALAFDRAATLYRMAIERGTEPATHEKLADALLHAGSTAAAGWAYLDAATHADGMHAVTLIGRAGEHLLSGGELAAGFDALERALGAVGETLPRDPRKSTFEGIRHFIVLRLRRFRFRETADTSIPREQLHRLDVLRSAMWGCAYVSIANALGIGMRYSRMALATGEPRRAAFGLCWASIGLMARQHAFPPAIDELLDTAEATAVRLSDPSLRAMAMRIRAQTNLMFGNFTRTKAICASAAELISDQCRGMSVHQRFVLAFMANSQLKLGELPDAKRVAEALLADAVERGDPVVERLACVAALAPLSLAADDPEQARDYLARLRTEDRCGNLLLGCDATASYAMYLDRPRDAVEAWRSNLAKLDDDGLLMQPLFHVLAVRSLVGALLAGPESKRDVRQAARLTRSIRRHAFPYARAVHAALQACWRVRDGRDDSAAALLLEAADHHAEVGALAEAAACRYRHGELVGDRAGLSAAESVLRRLGVVCPERWVTTVVPRITDLRGSSRSHPR